MHILIRYFKLGHSFIFWWKCSEILEVNSILLLFPTQQLWKANSKTALMASADVRTGRFPWWWSWLDRQLPSTSPTETQPLKNFQITPPRAISEHKPSPWTPLNNNRMPHRLEFDNISSATPRSSKSAIPASSKNLRMQSSIRTPAAITVKASKYSRSRANGAKSPYDHLSLKDDDSLTSCPPFSVPNYMAPTASAKAKVRPGSNPRDRFPRTATPEWKKRFFPLFSGKNSTSPGILDKRQPLHAIGNVSVDSTVSLPAGVGTGRKPFNRFPWIWVIAFSFGLSTCSTLWFGCVLHYWLTKHFRIRCRDNTRLLNVWWWKVGFYSNWENINFFLNWEKIKLHKQTAPFSESWIELNE